MGKPPRLACGPVLRRSSCLFWSILTWLAPLYQDEGLGEGRTALLLMLFSLVQVFAAFGVPALADRSRDRRPWLALVLVSTVAGLAALGILMLAGALLLRPQSREVPPV